MILATGPLGWCLPQNHPATLKGKAFRMMCPPDVALLDARKDVEDSLVGMMQVRLGGCLAKNAAHCACQCAAYTHRNTAKQLG